MLVCIYAHGSLTDYVRMQRRRFHTGCFLKLHMQVVGMQRCPGRLHSVELQILECRRVSTAPYTCSPPTFRHRHDPDILIRYFGTLWYSLDVVVTVLAVTLVLCMVRAASALCHANMSSNNNVNTALGIFRPLVLHHCRKLYLQRLHLL